MVGPLKYIKYLYHYNNSFNLIDKVTNFKIYLFYYILFIIINIKYLYHYYILNISIIIYEMILILLLIINLVILFF